MASAKNTNYLKALGPGILFASTCIGVSHLVQSTRAGADYGFALIWAVVLANIFKYPFFEFASRYANATGKSIIDGYKRLGAVYLLLYFIITIGTMFFVTAAVGYATAGFMQNLFGLTFEDLPIKTSAFLFLGSVIVLVLGKYKFLDGFVKIIGVVLLLSTVFAFILTLSHGSVADLSTVESPSIQTGVGFAFLIALMGWMPTALDISSWNSLWVVERMKQTNYRPKLKETLLDFNFGYIISGVLSLIFLIMGAYLLFGVDQNLPNTPVGFANGVIDLYTQVIGDWSFYIIATAAFSIMLGTCIAIFDGYARTVERCIALFYGGLSEKDDENGLQTHFYTVLVIVLAVGAFLIIWSFSADKNGFKGLVDFATTLSFIVAPAIALMNFRLVRAPYVNAEFVPPLWKRILAILGIVFLFGFTILYIAFKLGWSFW